MIKHYCYSLVRIRKDEEKLTLVTFEPSTIAVPLEFTVGECGWFCYKVDNDPDCWHRVKTSNVLSVTELSDGFDVETENSIYKFREIS